jgi:hypothetical protein
MDEEKQKLFSESNKLNLSITSLENQISNLKQELLEVCIGCETIKSVTVDKIECHSPLRTWVQIQV